MFVYVSNHDGTYSQCLGTPRPCPCDECQQLVTNEQYDDILVPPPVLNVSSFAGVSGDGDPIRAGRVAEDDEDMLPPSHSVEGLCTDLRRKLGVKPPQYSGR